jgi:hypothetical protein
MEPSARPASSYETRPRRSKTGHSRLAKMAIDFVGVGQKMVESGLPVFLDLSWGFEDDFDVPCRLYLKEFHLIAEEENCHALPNTFFEGVKTAGLEVKRNGDRWVFKATDGYRLDNKAPNIDQLFIVKGLEDADGPPSVKVRGSFPGSEQISVEWLEDAVGLDTQQRAVIDRFLATRQEGGKKGPVDLGWVEVVLVERRS